MYFWKGEDLTFPNMYSFPWVLWRYWCGSNQDLPYFSSILVPFSQIRNHLSSLVFIFFTIRCDGAYLTLLRISAIWCHVYLYPWIIILIKWISLLSGDEVHALYECPCRTKTIWSNLVYEVNIILTAFPARLYSWQVFHLSLNKTKFKTEKKIEKISVNNWMKMHYFIHRECDIYR